jgi:putative molybdopterin biosynthesis protein
MKPVYLNDIPLEEAWACFETAIRNANQWGILGIEEIPLDENAVGRILAEPVWARLSSPNYHASAMDGFVLRYEDTLGAAPNFPVIIKIGTQAEYIDTGDPIPDWGNAVIPIELTESLDEYGHITTERRHPASIRIRTTLTPWNHIRPMGEDIVATQLVLPAGQCLRPVDLGALAASGLIKVRVSRKPKVAILPTGTELIPIGEEIHKGKIIEFNSVVLAGQIQIWGGLPIRYAITIDDPDKISFQVQKAADESDLILLNAGSSAGAEDFSAQIVDRLGKLLVHGVAVRPGHPVVLGMVQGRQNSNKWVPIIGIPGYPVSAALTGEIFVEPLVSKWLGKQPLKLQEMSAVLTRKVNSPAGDDDYVRVVVGKVGENMLAAPIARGAGVISSLVQADGLMVLGRGIQGKEMGAEVKIRLYRTPQELENTIFIIGSHDMTLDLLAQFISKYQRRLVSANVGSMGGLIALRRGEAHLAGSHLLDPDTGDYNTSYIRHYLADESIMLMTWVGREQGLFVKPGNPKGIRSLGDLRREDIHFVNRQKGAGTRVLLDYHLGKLDIPSNIINGYNQEEFTHLSVAAAVASCRADCGLGVTAAARSLDLDFIPLFYERYDLVIPCRFARSPLLSPIFELVENQEFRKAVAEMPGYDISNMGNILFTS